MTQRNREKENEMSLEKKAKLEWRPEDSAHTDGRWTEFTGKGVNKKFHYETFEFHGQEYGLEETVVLTPEDKAAQRPYIAIIKDIYIQGNKGDVKLEVNWFYRPEDLDKKNAEKWDSKDSGDLIYSFHRDEVDAESVKRKCLVYFVPENEELTNPRASPDFIVRYVYDPIKKKIMNFRYKGFNAKRKDEINLLLEKTSSRIGDLVTIEEVQTRKISRRKKTVPKRYIAKADQRMIHESSTRVNDDQFYDEPIRNDFEVGEGSRALSSEPIRENYEVGEGSTTLSSELLDREKSLAELLEAVNQAGDYEVFPVVQALEQALYDSWVEDIPMYNFKVKNLVDNLKNSEVFAKRLLNGELKPEQAIKMTSYEQMRGFTFDEMKASFEEPTLEENVASTSRIVEPKDSFKG